MDEPGTLPWAVERRGWRWAAVLLCPAALAGAAVATAPPAAAAGCDAVTVQRLADRPTPSFAVAPPTALTGAALGPADVVLSQPRGPVAADYVRPLDPARIELAVVLETGAIVADRLYARAQNLATGVVEQLPAGVAVAVVAEGTATVVRPTTRHDEAVSALQEAFPSGTPAVTEAVQLAGEVLADPGTDRYRHVLLVSTGGDLSDRDVASTLAALERRGIGLTAVGVGAAADPAWGDQCPGSVRAGEVSGASALLAARLTRVYEVGAAAAEPDEPLTVRVRRGAVESGVQLPALDTAVRGTRVQGPEAGSGTPDALLWTVPAAAVVAVSLLLLVLRRRSRASTAGSPGPGAATMRPRHRATSRGGRRLRR